MTEPVEELTERSAPETLNTVKDSLKTSKKLSTHSNYFSKS